MASGWMRGPMLIGITSGPMASGWPMTKGGRENLEAVTLFCSKGQPPCCFSTSRSVVDRRKNPPPGPMWTPSPPTWAAPGIQPEVEHGLDGTTCSLFRA